MISKKNVNGKKVNGSGKAFAQAMAAYTKALEPMSIEDFSTKLKELEEKKIASAKAAAELRAPESVEDREGYARYCERKMELVMAEFEAIDETYKLLSDYYGGNI